MNQTIDVLEQELRVPDEPLDHRINPSRPAGIHSGSSVGREAELELARVALGLGRDWRVPTTADASHQGCPRLRIAGPPGIGKRALALEIQRNMKLPLYEMHGHAGMSAEDLLLAVVPRAHTGRPRTANLVLQASPLATALLWGGIIFFDALDRAPLNALAPLASLLDGRLTLYSGLTGLELAPQRDALPFVFLCAWESCDERSPPGFLAQRMLPVLTLHPLDAHGLRKVVGGLSVPDPEALMQAADKRRQEADKNYFAQEVAAFTQATLIAILQSASQTRDSMKLIQVLSELDSSQFRNRSDAARWDPMRGQIADRLFKLAIDIDDDGRYFMDDPESIQVYRALLDAGFDKPTYRNNLADRLMRRGELEVALTEIERVLRGEDLGFSTAWLTKGEILQAMGRIDEARECYQGAIRLGPEVLVDGKTSTATAEAKLAKLTRVPGNFGESDRNSA